MKQSSRQQNFHVRLLLLADLPGYSADPQDVAEIMGRIGFAVEGADLIQPGARIKVVRGHRERIAALEINSLARIMAMSASKDVGADDVIDQTV